jgi:hypothetical protein
MKLAPNVQFLLDVGTGTGLCDLTLNVPLLRAFSSARMMTSINSACFVTTLCRPLSLVCFDVKLLGERLFARLF